MQSCSNCFYQRDARMPGQIQTVKVCAFDPPKIYVLPAPNGGVQVAAFQTQVNPDQWCGKWIEAPIKPAANSIQESFFTHPKTVL